MSDSGHYGPGGGLIIYGVCSFFDYLINNPSLSDTNAMKKRMKLEAFSMFLGGFFLFIFTVNLYTTCDWATENCNSALSHTTIGSILVVGSILHYLYTFPYLQKHFFNFTVPVVFVSIGYNLLNHDQHGDAHDAAYLTFIHQSASINIYIGAVLHSICQFNTKFRMITVFFTLSSGVQICLGGPTNVEHFTHLEVHAPNVVFVASTIILTFMLVVTITVLCWKKKNNPNEYFVVKNNELDVEVAKDM